MINATEPPLRCSNDPSWYVCKMCDFHGHCHGDKVPAVNCRTCAHSTPEMNGDARWSCAKVNPDLNVSSIQLNMQRIGCAHHRYIPILLERIGTYKDYVNGDVVYEGPTGTFANGDGPGALTSDELRRMEDPRAAGAAAELKAQMAAQGIPSEVVR